MEHRRLGSTLRAIRIRRGWSQSELATAVGVSRWTVARIERGRVAGVRLGKLEQVAEALDAHIATSVLWRGGDLSRLLNARHSRLHEAVARRFERVPDWAAVPEVSFAIYGERGFIDVLAFHASTATVLVIELKTEIVDVQEVLGTLDRKRRLATRIAADRGWRAERTGAWLAVAEGRTNRRHVAAHRSVFAAALPDPARRVEPWLARPTEPALAALSFVAVADPRRR